MIAPRNLLSQLLKIILQVQLAILLTTKSTSHVRDMR